MKNVTRRALSCYVSAMAIGLALPSAAFAAETVTIGYAVSKSGPNAGGAGISTIPNYELWVHQVNEKGGLLLPDGSRAMIEVVEYDDRSSAEDAVRAIERLATQDKVDFILPPWGTGFNLAIAPLMDRFGYPQLAATAVTDMAPALAKRWDRSFWFLGGGHDYGDALASLLGDLKEKGQINDKVAAVSVADGFGIDLIDAARPALEEAGFDLVVDTTYPAGTSDFATMISGAAGSGADTFIAFSYPPESFGLTKEAQTAGFNPKVFYVGVGGAFPIYPNVTGGIEEGVMSVGGVDAASPAIQEYFAAHQEMTGKLPDSWASAITYTTLEVLEQAIARVGLDHAAVAEEIANGTFDTVIGEVTLQDNQLRDLWLTGQWQDGQFVAVAPADRDGASDPVVPKPAWD
ncbi:MAG: ABC transporter substrate-binding protein [Rhodobacteraceae bacterium]|nr:ABC transporter substrate-binding protein [Paracoccaceae bacterium]MBR9823889.1 ABC transporter substrate-binding protein [Paracoccaceae bacterium]